MELSGSSTTADDRSCSTAHTGSSSQVPAALVDCCKLVLKGLVSEHKLNVGYKVMIIDLVYLQTNSKVHSHSMVKVLYLQTDVKLDNKAIIIDVHTCTPHGCPGHSFD